MRTATKPSAIRKPSAQSSPRILWSLLGTVLVLPSLGSSRAVRAQAVDAPSTNVVVGTQYDTTHVYVAASEIDALVASFIATFGGHATARIVTNVLPVPSRTASQAVLTPSGNLSVFAFQTPIPFPFGQERTGCLVTDMDAAMKAAREAGAEVIVAPFSDPIGRDAVVQWPGGVNMQFYWHTTAPSSAPLSVVPENRIDLSADRADEFVRDILRFADGKLLADDPRADAREIGRAGDTIRRIQIDSRLGPMRLFVTDGHLPYPFGHEITGYDVSDLAVAIAKATASGAKVLSPAVDIEQRSSAIVEFPGGYVAEMHAPLKR